MLGTTGSSHLYLFDTTCQAASCAPSVLGAFALARLWHDVERPVDDAGGVVLLEGLEILIIGKAVYLLALRCVTGGGTH